MVSLWGLEKANHPNSALVHASVATALHSLSGSIAYRIVSNLFGFVWFGFHGIKAIVDNLIERYIYVPK